MTHLRALASRRSRPLARGTAFSRCSLLLSGLAAAAALTSSSASAQPVLGATDQAIVRGEAASSDQQWGTVGFLMSSAEGDYLCAGTLIAPNLILTAAHCVQSPENGERPSKIFTVVGATDIDEPDSDQTYEVRRVLAHPDAFKSEANEDESGLGARNDLALVQTTEDISQGEVISILPSDQVNDALSEGKKLMIAGYGRRQVVNGVSSEDGLHYVGETTVVRHSDKEILAGSSQDADTCPGDSGGPAYAVIDGKAWLVGVTSRGRDDFPNDDCGEGGLYTLASAYLDWIEQAKQHPDLSDDAWTPENPGGDDDDGADSEDDEDDQSGSDQDVADSEDDGPQDDDDDDEDESADSEDEDEDEDEGKERAGERKGCSAAPGSMASGGAEALLLIAAGALVTRRRKRA